MPEQSEIQGIYDQRVSHLNKFRTGMADIALEHNALAQQVQVHFMSKVKDIYSDTSNELQQIVDKRAIISKNPDMAYVQDLFDEIVEEDEKMPWLVKMTITDLPRLINHDDRITIGGILYSVSKASPINRLNDGLLKILVYPERTETD